MKLEDQSVINALKMHMPMLANAKRCIVAYSGGLDSTALLHAVKLLLDDASYAEVAKQQKPKLLAVHINHGLSKYADHWQRHCEKFAKPLVDEVQCIKVSVDVESKKGLEAAARKARYAAFEKLIQEGDVLLMAHHANDQAETLLLRLLRASGVKGLSAIRVQRELGKAQLLRPFLYLKKQQLLDYASQHQLKWVDDDSNVQDIFDRNYLRLKVLPPLLKRWPQAITLLNKSAQYFQESQDLMNQLAQIDLKNCLTKNEQWQALTINEKYFLELSIARRKNLIQYFLSEYFNYRIQESTLLAVSEIDFTHIQLPKSDLMLTYFDDRLWCYMVVRGDVLAEYTLSNNQNIVIEGCGSLGFSSEAYPQLQIKFRSGGERSHPAQRAHSQSLKKLLQEYKVPPWWRFVVPLFFYEEKLIAVGDLWLEKTAAQDLKIEWLKPELMTIKEQ